MNRSLFLSKQISYPQQDHNHHSNLSNHFSKCAFAMAMALFFHCNVPFGEAASFPASTVPNNICVSCSPFQTDADLNSIQSSGIKYVRTCFLWREMEEIPGKYKWTGNNDGWGLDTFVSRLNQRGLKLIFIIAYGNPLYGSPCTTTDGRQAYVKYAEALAGHYKDHGVIWEIWNEPDTDVFWPGHSADEYMALIDATVPAMRAADPSCKIVSGGVLNPSWSQTIAWLERCLDLGLHEQVDALAIHNYNGAGSSSNSLPERLIANMAKIRGMLSDHDAPNLPIIHTEWGSAITEFSGTVAEQEARQAEVCVRNYLLCQLNKLILGTWYEWKPTGGNSALSIKRADGTLRPSYTAIQVMANQLSGYAFEKRITVGGSNNVFALVFKNGVNRKVVVWTSSPTSQPVNVSVTAADTTSFPRVSMTGTGGSVSVQNAQFTLMATGSPVYIDVGTSPVHDSVAELRYEAESVAQIATSTSDAVEWWTYSEAGDAAHHKLLANAASDYITYTIPLANAGTYTVKACFKTGSTRGKFQLAIDGTPLGSIHDQYAANVSLVEVSLGSKTFTTPGSKLFKFTVPSAPNSKNAASTGYDLAFDCITLVPATYLFEAEHLVQAAALPSNGVSVITDALGSAGAWEKLDATSASQYIAYTVNLPSPGTYAIRARAKRYPSRGRFQLAIQNFTQPGGDQDQYYPAGSWFEYDLGTKAFSTSGNKEFKFTVTGKNANATGYTLSVDCIKLIGQ